MGILREVADIRGNEARLPLEIITIRGKNIDVKKNQLKEINNKLPRKRKLLLIKSNTVSE